MNGLNLSRNVSMGNISGHTVGNVNISCPELANTSRICIILLLINGGLTKHMWPSCWIGTETFIKYLDQQEQNQNAEYIKLQTQRKTRQKLRKKITWESILSSSVSFSQIMRSKIFNDKFKFDHPKVHCGHEGPDQQIYSIWLIDFNIYIVCALLSHIII